MSNATSRPPLLDEYQAAVQVPAVAFVDPKLRAGSVELSPQGLPYAWSGGFAIAFRVRQNGADSAVRCFQKLTDDLESRYAKISAFTGQRALRALVPIDYQAAGVLVKGKHWPITVMPWVTGQTLDEWLADHGDDPASIERLQKVFAAIVAELERASIAHGDLQHGNIVVGPSGEVTLIDYDGMYVPALRGLEATEAGHPNYQHPDRDQLPFGPGIDRFSAIVIWSALEVARREPDVWEQFTDSESLLFTSRDYARPGESAALAAISRLTTLRPLAENLGNVFRSPVESVPTLAEFIAGRVAAPVAKSVHRQPVAPFPVVDLSSDDPAAFLGQRVIAIGPVLAHKAGTTRFGGPYLFLDVGTWSGARLTVVIWPDVVARRPGIRSSPPDNGQLVAVTGLVSEYRDHVQIVLEQPSLLELIDRRRALELTGAVVHPGTAPARIEIGDTIDVPGFGRGVVTRLDGPEVHIKFGALVRKIWKPDPRWVVRRRQPPEPPPAGTKAGPPPTKGPAPVRVGDRPDLGKRDVDALQRMYGGRSTSTTRSTRDRARGAEKPPSAHSPQTLRSAPPTAPASAPTRGPLARFLAWLRGG